MISIPFFLGASLSQAKTPAIEQLKEWLALPKSERNLITDNKFSNMPISKSEAEEAQVIIWQDHVSLIKSQRLNEMKNKRIKIGDKTLKFDFLIYGEKPKSGRSLYISMHGGGGAPPHVNDGQWKIRCAYINLKKAYTSAQEHPQTHGIFGINLTLILSLIG